MKGIRYKGISIAIAPILILIIFVLYSLDKTKSEVDYSLYDVSGIRFKVPIVWQYWVYEKYKSWPKNYKNTGFKNVNRFDFSLTYPNLEPYTKNPIKFEAPGQDDIINIVIQSSSPIPIPKYLKNIESQLHINKQPCKICGEHLFHFEKFTSDSPDAIVRDLYIKKDYKNNNYYSIHCDRARPSEGFVHTKCHLYKNFRGDLHYKAIFNSKKIDQWKEIELKIDNVVSSLIVN